MKKIISILSCVVLLVVAFVACQKETEILPVQDVTNLIYSIDGRQVTLSWTLPAEEEVVAVQVVKENDKTFTEVQGAATSYIIERAEAGVDLTYTVRVITPISISTGASITFQVVPDKQAVPAMLLLAAEPEALPDDDERYAANWFKENYIDKNNGAFVTVADLPQLSVDDYSVLFVLVDRVGLEPGWQNLPAELVSNESINGLKQYMANGGNIFFAKHATQLLAAIGRIEDRLAPGLYGSGEGGIGDDVWYINAMIGVCCDDVYDHRSHPIFQLMENNTTFYGNHDAYPMMGPALREDHNCMWDCNAYGFEPNPNVIKSFEEATSSTVLATWGHVEDYCCAGIIEFHATAEYKGTAIANGLSAYEFDPNGYENPYQDNILKLTENTINYLSRLAN